HARLVPLRRPCDLVDGRQRNRRGRARAAAALRRIPHDRDERERGRHPVTAQTPERRTAMFRNDHSTGRNLAARMGGWSADHWKTATLGWLAFVLVAFQLGNVVGVKTIDPNTSGPGQSGRMDRILADGF